MLKFSCFIFLILQHFSAVSQEPSFQLVISEIFADPTPSHGLPESEFIEIYNPSNNVIDLKGYSIKYSNQSKTIISGEIKPKSYLIICKNSNVSLFESICDAIGIENLSLINSGSEIALYNNDKKLVDYVNYDFSWYKKGFDQGYSLELIDINKPCKKENNWTSSLDPKGASPGKTNSVNNNLNFLNGPKIKSIRAQKDTLNVEFDTELDFNFMSNLSNYQIDNGITFKKIIISNSKGNAISLIISRKLNFNEVANLQILELRDCLGNATFKQTALIGELAPAQNHDILISEILFNSKATDYDYIEIYNQSQKKINLKSWYIANNNSSYKIEDNELIILPNQYLVFSENINNLNKQFQNFEPSFSNYHELLKLPSFPNTTQDAKIFNSDSLLIDEIHYDEKYHSEITQNKQGVSLERITFKKNAMDQSNWQSASSLLGNGSPGKPNSSYLIEGSENNQINIEPEIFYLNEKQNYCEIEFKNLINGSFMNIEIFDKNGVGVFTLLPFTLVNSFGKIKWYGNTNSGFAPVGIYLLVININSINQKFKVIRKVVVAEN